MEAVITTMRQKAFKLLPTATGYAREQLNIAIYEATGFLRDLQNPDFPREKLREKYVNLTIRFAEGGVI